MGLTFGLWWQFSRSFSKTIGILYRKRTDYWQSQAKKFCDFCKCWITDNKPSIEFHERGKKHKENVARRIKEVHKRGVQTVKDNEELKRNLQAIENAALEAYKKDIGEEAFNRATQKTSTAAKPVYQQNTCQAETTTTSTGGGTSSTGCTIVYNDGQPVAHCSHHWSIAQSPEGYYYYYNSETLGSQWEVPVCLQTPDNDTTDETPNEHQVPTQPSTLQQKEDQEEKQQEMEKNKDQEDQDKNTKVKWSSPYGAWRTVRTIEQPPPNICKTTDTDEFQRNSENCEENKETEDPEITAKKTENKFKERQTPKINCHQADDQVVAFKKRKVNSERKRNVRQTQLS